MKNLTSIEMSVVVGGENIMEYCVYNNGSLVPGAYNTYDSKEINYNILSSALNCNDNEKTYYAKNSTHYFRVSNGITFYIRYADDAKKENT